MSSAIGRVLGFLRLLPVENGWSAYTHAQQLVGQGATAAQIAKLIAWILDTTDAADGEINALAVDQEMKDGILHITAKLGDAFTGTNINNNLGNYFPAMPQTIGSLKSFLKVTNLDHTISPGLASDLLTEIEDTLHSEALAALDPRMAEIARRHLRLLTITLNHLDAFGVEAAMIAYSELIVRLQGAMQNATATEKTNAKSIVERMGTWWKRLQTLNEAYEAGTKLLENASEIGAMLGID